MTLEQNSANGPLPTASPIVTSTTTNTSSVNNAAASSAANIITGAGAGMSAGGVSEAVRLARLLQATQDDYYSGTDRRFLEYQRFPVQVPFCPFPVTNNDISGSSGSGSGSGSGSFNTNPFTSATGSSYTTNQGLPVPKLQFGCAQPNIVGL
jgi:hypothetical protein